MAEERHSFAPRPFGIVLKDPFKDAPPDTGSAPAHDCQNGANCCFLDCERHFIGTRDHGQVTFPRRFWDMNAENAKLINENYSLERRLSMQESYHEHMMRGNNVYCRQEVTRHHKAAMEEESKSRALGRQLGFADIAKEYAERAKLDSESRLTQAQKEMMRSKTTLRAAHDTIRQLTIEKHELSKDKVELVEKVEYAVNDLEHEVGVQKRRARECSKQVHELEKEMKRKDEEHEREIMANIEAHEHWMNNADLSREALKEMLLETVAEKQTMAKEVEDLKLQNAMLKLELGEDEGS